MSVCEFGLVAVSAITLLVFTFWFGIFIGRLIERDF